MSQPLLDATLPRSDAPSSASESPRAGSPVHAADVKHTEGGFVDRMIERQLDKPARLGVAALEAARTRTCRGCAATRRCLPRGVAVGGATCANSCSTRSLPATRRCSCTGSSASSTGRPARPPSAAGRSRGAARRALHTLLPADMSQWQVARDPNALCLLLRAVCPYFGISTWMFVLLFFLIDKRDEYQLCNYILKFKATQFLSSGTRRRRSRAPSSTCVRSKTMRATARPARTDRNSTFIYEIVVEPIRIVILWLAFALSRVRATRAAAVAHFALEAVRIDAADGQLDGVRDLELLRKLSLEEGRVCTRRGRWPHSTRSRAPTACSGGRAARAILFTVRCAVGGALRALLGFAMWWNELTTDDWAFWTSLYFTKGAYAMLSAPFLLFFGPLSQFLTHARPTGYDKAGLLCPSLSARECGSKYQLDQSRKKKKEEERRRERAREMGAPSGGGTLRRVVRIAPGAPRVHRRAARGVGVGRDDAEDGGGLGDPAELAVAPADDAPRSRARHAGRTRGEHPLWPRAHRRRPQRGAHGPYVKVRVGHHRKQTRFLPCAPAALGRDRRAAREAARLLRPGVSAQGARPRRRRDPRRPPSTSSASCGSNWAEPGDARAAAARVPPRQARRRARAGYGYISVRAAAQARATQRPYVY